MDTEMARKGGYTILLTPTKPVPKNWIGDVSGKDLLCLASGGQIDVGFVISGFYEDKLGNGL